LFDNINEHKRSCFESKKEIGNEKKFPNFEELPDGSRIYWFELVGKLGWKARYVKTVDADEKTLSFKQEIYDENEKLVEIHEKFPEDKGHIILRNDDNNKTTTGS
jgi:hypothetical protein